MCNCYHGYMSYLLNERSWLGCVIFWWFIESRWKELIRNTIVFLQRIDNWTHAVPEFRTILTPDWSQPGKSDLWLAVDSSLNLLAVGQTTTLNSRIGQSGKLNAFGFQYFKKFVVRETIQLLLLLHWQTYTFSFHMHYINICCYCSKHTFKKRSWITRVLFTDEISKSLLLKV